MTLNKAWAEHFAEVAPHYMRLFRADFGASREDAAAVFGNAGHESKGLTDDQEDKPVVAGSRGGLNWMQWTGPRRKDMEAYCARNKIDPASDEAAYKWLFLELNGPEKAALAALFKAKTLNTKVEAFEKAYLRSGVKAYASRKEWAAFALEVLNKADDIVIPISGRQPDDPGVDPADPVFPPQTWWQRLVQSIVDALLSLLPRR